MTDKEERMLLLKNGDILMFRKWAADEGDIPCWCMELYYNFGKNLPLAPKHTDEEYAELLMLWEAQAVTIASMLHHEDKYRLRIKELEAKLKPEG